jgi:TetR/AcrR family transcriptional repressor of nem operon
VGRPRTYEREVALASAMEAFWERGYSATSIRDLVQAMQMVPKSVYAEFGGKDALFVTTIEHYVAEQSARYRVLLGEAPFGLERIEGYFESLREGREHRGCFLVNSLAESASIPAEALERVQDFFRWLEGLYLQNLEAAARAGTLRPGVDVARVASALVVYDQGLAVASRSSAQSSGLSDGALALLDALRA